MALSEVQRFMSYLNKNRQALEVYNKKLCDYSSFLYLGPAIVSTGYYATPMIPEPIEDELLLKIVEIDGKAAKRLEKINQSKGKEISVKQWLVEKFDELIYKESSQEHILNEEETKRHQLFERLAELAREEGFNISTDDLLYFIGKAVLVIIEENPDYSETQVFNAVLKSFD